MENSRPTTTTTLLEMLMMMLSMTVNALYQDSGLYIYMRSTWRGLNRRLAVLDVVQCGLKVAHFKYLFPLLFLLCKILL